MNQSLLEASCNTRDLGGFPAAGGVTKENRIWRSDVPGPLTDRDTALLWERGITTAIDLRTPVEAAKRPSPFAGLDGFQYHHFPITEGSEPPARPEDVPASYLTIAASPGAAQALKAAAEAEAGVLLHCTAGKDRTGVLSAILLAACGVSRDRIARDYEISREYNRERLEAYLAAHPQVDRRTVTARKETMERFLTLFQEKYDGVPGYFSALGLPGSCLDALRRKLLG